MSKMLCKIRDLHAPTRIAATKFGKVSHNDQSMNFSVRPALLEW